MWLDERDNHYIEILWKMAVSIASNKAHKKLTALYRFLKAIVGLTVHMQDTRMPA